MRTKRQKNEEKLEEQNVSQLIRKLKAEKKERPLFSIPPNSSSHMHEWHILLMERNTFFSRPLAHLPVYMSHIFS